MSAFLVPIPLSHAGKQLTNGRVGNKPRVFAAHRRPAPRMVTSQDGGVSGDGPLYLGVDVGTGSVRAMLTDAQGRGVRRAERATRTRNRLPQHYEQSTGDIWGAMCGAVKEACGAEAGRVAGIGIDATCSMVASDASSGAPVSVGCGTFGKDDSDVVWDVLLWMDQRAAEDADVINSTETRAARDVLRAFGGRISAELEPPKLRWLARRLPHAVTEDLADWIVQKCTDEDAGAPAGARIRSACTNSGKWGRAVQHGWDASFWKDIGLPQLRDNRMNADVRAPGARAGTLSAWAAGQLGLSTECVVAVPMVDAHCGAIGVLGARGDLLDKVPLYKRMAVLAGTSTCYIGMCDNGANANGIWGPYRDALVDGLWCVEAGQTATGHLLAHIVKSHAAYASLVKRVGDDMGLVFDELDRIVNRLIEENGGEDPAGKVHVLDSFAGNRTPFADASLRGAIIGLELSCNESDLAIYYRAAIQALCYGARMILNRLGDAGHDIQALCLSGSMARNTQFLQELADITGKTVHTMRSRDDEEIEPTMLGGAILAAAAHDQCDVQRQMRIMTETFTSRTLQPRESTGLLHDRKFQVYQLLFEHYKMYQSVMGGSDEHEHSP